MRTVRALWWGIRCHDGVDLRVSGLQDRFGDDAGNEQ